MVFLSKDHFCVISFPLSRLDHDQEEKGEGEGEGEGELRRDREREGLGVGVALLCGCDRVLLRYHYITIKYTRS